MEEWYKKDVQTALKELEVSENGLEENIAAERLKKMDQIN